MAEQKQPLVTVVMPAYNAEAYVEKAIRSVIHQTYSNWELVVVDDRSTDGTYEIIQRVAAEDGRIKAYRNEQNMGVARSRNFGILQGEGKYIAFLDSDDVWLDESWNSRLPWPKKARQGLPIAPTPSLMQQATRRRKITSYRNRRTLSTCCGKM